VARGGRGTSELYPTAGDTTDRVFGEYAVSSCTVELPPATALEGGFIQLQLEQAGLAQLAGQPGAIGSAYPRPLVPIR
jgi:hypothetical protein